MTATEFERGVCVCMCVCFKEEWEERGERLV